MEKAGTFYGHRLDSKSLVFLQICKGIPYLTLL